ncbi:MAG: hypothetical protein AAGF84_04345 [Planctomycetota bacterium]
MTLALLGSSTLLALIALSFVIQIDFIEPIPGERHQRYQSFQSAPLELVFSRGRRAPDEEAHYWQRNNVPAERYFRIYWGPVPRDSFRGYYGLKDGWAIHFRAWQTSAVGLLASLMWLACGVVLTRRLFAVKRRRSREHSV